MSTSSVGSTGSVQVVPALQVPPLPSTPPPPRSCLKRRIKEIHPPGVLLLGRCDKSEIETIQTLYWDILEKFPVMEERCLLATDGEGFSMTLFFEPDANYNLTMKRLERFQRDFYGINVTNYHRAEKKSASDPLRQKH